MRRQKPLPFLAHLAVAGLALLAASILPALAARSEGRWDPASPAAPANDTLRVCGGNGQSFDEDSGPLVETIAVTGLPAGSHVAHVTVDLNILHSWSGDVVATLAHGPASVTLVDRPGTSNAAFNCDCGCPYDDVAGAFGDNAAGDAERCELGVGGVDPAHGPYAPAGPGALADFAGMDPNGAWTLTLVDRADDEGGSLPPDGVCLNITYGIPLAVGLASFAATQQDGSVLLAWETVSELDNQGFNLYRGASAAGPGRQLNAALIPSQLQGNPGGFVYTWEDHANLVPGTTYFYWVEDVDIHGVATLHGPVSIDDTGPTAVTLAGLQAKPADSLACRWLRICLSPRIWLSGRK